MEYLTAAISFSADGFPQDNGIIGQNEGSNRQAIHRWAGDDRHLAHPGQGHLQGPRDWRRGQCQHMNIGAQLLHAFLLLNAEMLFLINDQQAQITDFDGFRQQGMGANDNIDCAIGQTFLYALRLFSRHKAGQLAHPYRQSFKAFFEIAEMLTGQKGRGDDDSDLFAGQGDQEGGTQPDLCFAKPDIPTDQPIHWLAGPQILKHILNGAQLVFGFGEGEARTELIIRPFLRDNRIALAQGPLRRDLHQRLGDFPNPFLQPRLAGLPGGPAQLVQLNT